jgi:hypothetical protein
MAKKSISELKKGLIHNCGHCGAKCNDKFALKELTGTDTEICYMGQFNLDIMKIKYYCSRDCINYVYRTTQLAFLDDLKSDTEISRNRIKTMYLSDIKNGRKIPNKSEVLLLLKYQNAEIDFYDAVIQGKSLYELHSLRLFAMNLNKKMFEFEDGTVNEGIIHSILYSRKHIEELDITVFPKKTY